jgi:hypothetical protein
MKPTKPKRLGKKFTRKDDDILRESYGILPREELCELLGRNDESIYKRARYLGLTKKLKEWTDEELKYLIENYKSLSYDEIGRNLGRTRKAITIKVFALGLDSKRDPFWSDIEIEYLKKVYEDAGDEQSIQYDVLEEKFGRLRSNICRKARELGLTNKNRVKTDLQKEENGIKMKKWHETHEHPRGMLGKHVSEKNKILYRQLYTGRKMNFTEEQLQGYRMRARETIGKLMNGTNMYSRTKSGIRADLQNKFFRSSWEANYARILDFQNIKWLYEPKTFFFEGEQRGGTFIIPDFQLTELDAWVEVKGWLDSRSKSKLTKFKKYYPLEFEKLMLIIDGRHQKTAEWLTKLGVKKIVDYYELRTFFKPKIPLWEEPSKLRTEPAEEVP